MPSNNLFLKEITIRNFLSYGADTAPFALEALNVLIGPNMSGKSNFLEALSVLRETPRDFASVFHDGITEWMWKGHSPLPTAKLEAVIDNPNGYIEKKTGSRANLRYSIAFSAATFQGVQQMKIQDEFIENANISAGYDDSYFFYRYQNGDPIINVIENPQVSSERKVRHLRDNFNPRQSVLSQRKDPESYPELTYLAAQLQRTRIYCDWALGRSSAPRLPQPADRPSDFLLEDASNLGLIVNDLEHQHPREWALIIEFLRQFYPGILDVSTSVKANQIQLFLAEQGLGGPKIPATRISDGMMRFLCLLVILCHPEPPPLICIEEPEIGLHPDAIGIVAKLLKDASTRTQVVVTTHSEDLVSALSDTPQYVVVCEKDEGRTSLQRLSRERLAEWLEDYTLGELWAKGEIGGTSRP